MCTAAVYKTRDFYFGRTLDYEFSYGDEITIAPRNFPFHFRNMGEVRSHHAMIGMAHVAEGCPLYYEAANEAGLCMAGLNFPEYAAYNETLPYKDNILQAEFIPWILCQCSSVAEARGLLSKINIVKTPFNDKLPVASLHWMLADKTESVTIECVKGECRIEDGKNCLMPDQARNEKNCPAANRQTENEMKIYNNPVGILTNSPPFDMQMTQLNNYINLSAREPENRFSDKLNLKPVSRGMGAMGLPGDLSSPSRFVRAAFVKMNSKSGESEPESVSQFFHILGSVAQPRGCCELEGEKFESSANFQIPLDARRHASHSAKYEITIYTCCINADKGIYYYTTYDNHQISAVSMNNENLNGDKLVRYQSILGEHIYMQN